MTASTPTHFSASTPTTSGAGALASHEKNERIALIRLGELRDAIINLQHDFDLEPPHNTFTEGSRKKPLVHSLNELVGEHAANKRDYGGKGLASGILIKIPYSQKRDLSEDFVLFMGYEHYLPGQEPKGLSLLKTSEQVKVWLIPYKTSNLVDDTRAGYFTTPAAQDEDILTHTLVASEDFGQKELDACDLKLERLAEVLLFNEPQEVFYTRLMSSIISPETVIAMPALIRLIGYLSAKILKKMRSEPSLRLLLGKAKYNKIEPTTRRFSAFLDELRTNLNFVLDWLYPYAHEHAERLIGEQASFQPGSKNPDGLNSKSGEAESVYSGVAAHFEKYAFELHEMLSVQDMELLAKESSVAKNLAISALNNPVKELIRVDLCLENEKDNSALQANMTFFKACGKTHILVVSKEPGSEVSKGSGKTPYTFATAMKYEPLAAYRDKQQAKLHCIQLNEVTGQPDDDAFFMLDAPCFNAQELVDFVKETGEQYR